MIKMLAKKPATTNTIFGNDFQNTLMGTSSNDRIKGLGDIDELTGFDGDDILEGGKGNDFLYGDLGNDWLDGGAGRDVLYMDIGNDTAKGGKGSDTFYFLSNPAGIGSDTILDFKAKGKSADKLNLTSLGFNDFALGDKGLEDGFEIVKQGKNVIINYQDSILGTTGTILLKEVKFADINANDFILI